MGAEKDSYKPTDDLKDKEYKEMNGEYSNEAVRPISAEESAISSVNNDEYGPDDEIEDDSETITREEYKNNLAEK